MGMPPCCTKARNSGMLFAQLARFASGAGEHFMSVDSATNLKRCSHRH